MAGTMGQADLVADLKASLMNSAEAFTAAGDADFVRHLGAAALDFSRARPLTLLGSLTLVADRPDYDPPTDFHAFKSHLWGISPRQAAQPWEKNYPGRIPAAREVKIGDAVHIYLDPAPSAFQISALGSEFRFYYYARHAVDADAAKTTIRPGDRGLFLLRAQAEAMKELAMRNITKPMAMRDGISSMPRNGTPSHLFGVLMDEFTRQAA